MAAVASTSIRDRTRRAVRADLTEIAIDLFLAHGYDEVTVEQIADEAGISRRTFHRYFPSKDAVLTDALAEAGERVARALSRRPAREEPWTALRRAFDVLVAEMDGSDRALAMTRMMYGSPATHASHLRKQARWRRAIAGALAERLPGTDDRRRELEATALAAAAIACQESAQAAWVAGGPHDSLALLLDTAMGAVRPVRAEH
jgi:AcrR family transcriptional regulator